MCGIAGVCGWTDTSQLSDMLETIRHRGPDSEGTFEQSDKIMMGTRRLAIIDLDGGNQPISNEDGTVTVVFNGEIYNHEELRADLESEGHRFETDCDTEVLVHLWEEHGRSLTGYLDGMFAFSIWDSDSEVLFLARDRIGIKPLFYSMQDGSLVWGSSVQSLLAAGVDKTISPDALYKYFSLNYTPWPQTLFRGVKKLPPGSSITFEDGEIEQERYWDVERNREGVPTSPAAISDEIRERLTKSVERRLMADVPVGAFLSGGIDSSAIVGILDDLGVDDIRTFSISFAQEYHDESDEAQFVADHFGTDHTEIDVDLSSMETFREMVTHYGEPLADPAVLPTMLLAKRASDDVKVVLTGEGADEMFAGYGRYWKLQRHRNTFGKIPSSLLNVAGRLEKHVPAYEDHFRYLGALRRDETAFLEWKRSFNEPPEEYTDINSSAESSGLLNQIQTSFDPAEDIVDKISRYDLQYQVNCNQLYRSDHATMASSLEARTPFLDHELVTLAYNIPAELKIERGDYKPMLKRAVSDLLPERTLERSKHGMAVPIGDWFRDGHDGIEAWLTESKINAVPYLSADTVHTYWDEHRSGRESHSQILWKVLNYVAWYHEFVHE